MASVSFRTAEACVRLVGAGLVLTGALLMGLSGAAQAGFRSHRGDLEIFVVNADGSGLRNLTNRHTADSSPAWSPDGRKIVFSQNVRGYSEIFIMDVDGTRQKNLTNNPANDGEPAWSPDGRRIAFTRARPGYHDTAEIYVMNRNGSGQRNLTNHAGPDGEPAWSPDGTRIAFTRRGCEILIMNADGTGQTKLTDCDVPAVIFAQEPAWSPDGRRIAFSEVDRGCDTIGDIYVMNADGTGQPTNLTRNQGLATSSGAAWSPDGRRMAFAKVRWNRSGCDASPRRAGVFVMSANGGGQRELTTNRLLRSGPQYDSGGRPTWSPHGNRIAFASHPKTCYVPNVVGRRLRHARTAIRRSNCSVGRVRYARSRSARGRVMRQSVQARTDLPYGGRVDLLVSLGNS